MQDLNPIMTQTPSPLAQRLGYAGLLPFIGLTALLWIVQADLVQWLAMALASYAALIASFLGGVHWGLAALRPSQERNFHYAWGITPSLIAWLALLMPTYAGLPLLAALLIACAAVDRKTYPQLGMQAWLKLRTQLSAVAALACLLAAGVS